MFILKYLSYKVLKIWQLVFLPTFKVYVFLSAKAGRISTTDLVNKLYTFCEVYSGRTLFPYQAQFGKRLIRSVITNDGAEITALFARQSGKSETVSVIVGGLMIILPQLANMPMFATDTRFEMFKDGFWVGIFAPSLRQSQITYNRIKSRLQSKTAHAVLSDPEFNLYFSTSNGQTVSLSNGSFVTAISASDGSSIEGESFKLIICEEAQDISNFKILKSIHPMGAAYNASIIKIGTSTTFKANFYDAIQRNKSEYKRQGNKGIRNHFEYDCDVASKYNKRYAKYVEKEKIRLGENSDEFQMSYKLKWIISRGMFIDLAEFEVRNLDPMLEIVEYDKSATHVAGIDVGGKGDDTVITIVEVDWSMPVIMEERTDEETGESIVYLAYNTYLKGLYVISNMPDYEEQYPLIMNYLDNWKLARIMIDATKEASLAHRIRANRKEEVIPYIFTPKSKSEMYKHAEKEIVSGRAIVPSGEHTRKMGEYRSFLQQLSELQKGYRGSYLVVSHPDERDAHDDFPDSWALALLAASSQGTVNETETKDNVFTKKDKSTNDFYRRRNNYTSRRR